jgi:DTW domain-containing protein YfiP
LEKRTASLIEKNRCSDCFMSKSMCVCERTRAIWAAAPRPRTNIALFYHYKEWGRASNTGKLLSIGLGAEKVKSFVYGNPADEAALNSLLTSRPSAILFPGTTSIPIHTVMASWSSSRLESEESQTPKSAPSVLCILDATWTQAFALERVLSPLIPRVALDSLAVQRPSEFLSRRQSGPTKVSSIEAAALALTELGEPLAVTDCIRRSLQLSVDSMLVQGGKSTAFNNDVRPNVEVDCKAGPFTAPAIAKPEQCPVCGTRPARGFRNLGVRRPWDDEGKKRGDNIHRVWRCSDCEAFFNEPLATPS